MGINMRFRLYLKCHDFENKMGPFVWVRFLKHKNKDTKNCKHIYQMLMQLILGKGTKDDCYILF